MFPGGRGLRRLSLMPSGNEVITEINNLGIIEQATFWEHAAQSAWGTYISEIEKEAILRAHDIACKPARALEIGCEGGRWSKLLSGLEWKMTCTDVDARVLRLCKMRLPAASCILVEPESEEIPCEASRIGLLLCVECPPVIKSGWFLDESRRVLTEGGLIVGVFFNLVSWRGLLAHLTAPMRRSYDYFGLSYAAWRKKLRSNGFAVVHERGLCWFPFRRSSNSSLIPACVGFERRMGLQKLPELSPWVVFIARKNSA